MERPNPHRQWKTKEGDMRQLSDMDYNYLKNCKNMLERGNKAHLAMYSHLNEEIKYREWKKKNSKDNDPTSRFDLIDLD